MVRDWPRTFIFPPKEGFAWRASSRQFSSGASQGSREARDPITRAALEEMAKHVREYLVQLPLRRGTTPLKLAPEYEDWLVSAMSHGENDAYWKQPGFDVVDQTGRYKD